MACSRNPSPGAGDIGPEKFSADVTDAAGDAIVDPRVSRAPDLIAATVKVSDDWLLFDVRFAHGSYVAEETDITIQLDTDLSRATGTPAGPGFGFDYTINAGKLYHASGYRVSRVARGECPPEQRGGCFEVTGSGPTVFAVDAIRMTVPRRAIRGLSGPFSFRLQAYVHPPGAQFSITTDFLPQLNALPAQVRGTPR